MADGCFVALLATIAYYGCWRRRPWARTIGLAVLWPTAVIVALIGFNLIIKGLPPWRGPFGGLGAIALGWGVGALVGAMLLGLMIWMLHRAK